jgi:hypothetical protein
MMRRELNDRGLTLYLGGLLEAWWLGLALATVGVTRAVWWLRWGAWSRWGRGSRSMFHAEALGIALMGGYVLFVIALIVRAS